MSGELLQLVFTSDHDHHILVTAHSQTYWKTSHRPLGHCIAAWQLHCVCGGCWSQMHRDTCCWHTLLDRMNNQVQGLRDGAVVWTTRRRRLQLVDCCHHVQRTRHHQVTSLQWQVRLQVWRVSLWALLTSDLQHILYGVNTYRVGQKTGPLWLYTSSKRLNQLACFWYT